MWITSEMVIGSFADGIWKVYCGGKNLPFEYTTDNASRWGL